MRTGSARVVWLLMPFLVIGCSGCSNSRACTSIGAESGISVELKGVPVAEGDSVRVCVAGECNEVRVGDPSVATFVRNAQVESERTTPVVVSVWDARGGELVRPSEFLVRPQRFQPNGEGCDPVVYMGSVAISAAT